MTNRDMVKPATAATPDHETGQEPNPAGLPPQPAPEDSPTPTIELEPIDSPQPNASGKRGPPRPGEIGLSTKR